MCNKLKNILVDEEICDLDLFNEDIDTLPHIKTIKI